jgi:hypothetical protein
MVWFIIGIICLAIAGGLWYASQGQAAKSTAMAVADTHTAQELQAIHERIVGSIGSDAFAEQCEVKGIIECDSPLSAPLSETPCVAYVYKVIREYEEEVTERDEEGNEEIKVKSGSETMETNDQRVQFWVRDETGRILVDPTNADIDMKKTGERFDDEDDQSWQVNRRTVGYRKTEQALAVGNQVYVLGCATDVQGQPTMQRHPQDKSARFLISWKTEQELMSAAESGSRNYQIASYVLGGLGLLLIVLGFVF